MHREDTLQARGKIEFATNRTPVNMGQYHTMSTNSIFRLIRYVSNHSQRFRGRLRSSKDDLPIRTCAIPPAAPANKSLAVSDTPAGSTSIVSAMIGVCMNLC